MAFNPNGVAFPSMPEPEPIPRPLAKKSDEPDPAGGMLDFFKHGDPVTRLLEYPLLRGYVTDANFCKRLRKIRHEAEAAKTPEAVAKLTREMLNDPRLTQCSMLGNGMTLTVDETDLTQAERLGDIDRRSPIRVEDVVTAEKTCADKEAAKAAGNERFAAGDAAGALAFWARALRIDREAGRPDDVDFAGAVYCNVAAALLKLDRWDRAEQAASRAIKHCDFARARATEARIRMDRLVDVGELDELDESHPALTRRLLDDATRRKALYRRALAREKCRRGLEAHQDCVEARRLADAVKSGATAGEKNLLRREQLRLGKVKAAFDEQLKQRALRKAEEAAVAYQRASGVTLPDKKVEATAPTPGASIGYLEEHDYSRWALKRLAVLLEDVEVELGKGASVAVTELLKRQSTVHASVTKKKGKRALYYDVDVHATWTAEPATSFDLSPDDSAPARDRPRPLEGTVRLYNVSHETRYEPGADPTVAYMYQLGYKGLDPKWFDGARATPAAPPWAALLVNGAHELYEGVAVAVDRLIAELKKK